jgi:hypothetical protein
MASWTNISVLARIMDKIKIRKKGRELCFIFAPEII